MRPGRIPEAEVEEAGVGVEMEVAEGEETARWRKRKSFRCGLSLFIEPAGCHHGHVIQPLCQGSLTTSLLHSIATWPPEK